MMAIAGSRVDWSAHARVRPSYATWKAIVARKRGASHQKSATIHDACSWGAPSTMGARSDTNSWSSQRMKPAAPTVSSS